MNMDDSFIFYSFDFSFLSNSPLILLIIDWFMFIINTLILIIKYLLDFVFYFLDIFLCYFIENYSNVLLFFINLPNFIFNGSSSFVSFLYYISLRFY